MPVGLYVAVSLFRRPCPAPVFIHISFSQLPLMCYQLQNRCSEIKTWKPPRKQKINERSGWSEKKRQFFLLSLSIVLVNRQGNCISHPKTNMIPQQTMSPLGAFFRDMKLDERYEDDEDDTEFLPRIITDDCKGHHVDRMNIKPCRRQDFLLRATSSSRSSSRQQRQSRRRRVQASSSSSCACCDPIRPEDREQRWSSVPVVPHRHHDTTKKTSKKTLVRSCSSDDVVLSSFPQESSHEQDSAPTPCMRLPSPKKTSPRPKLLVTSPRRRHSLTGSTAMESPSNASALYSILLTHWGSSLVLQSTTTHITTLVLLFPSRLLWQEGQGKDSYYHH